MPKDSAPGGVQGEYMVMDDYGDEDEVRRLAFGPCFCSPVGLVQFRALLQVWLVWMDKTSEKQEKSIRQLAQEARQGNAHDENVLTYYR